jgi:hypothetical protein
MFASLNSCRGNNKSRRDDIESIFYLMIYLYNNNYLPWRDFKGTFKQMVVQRLQLRVTKSLFKMIPCTVIPSLLCYRMPGRVPQIRPAFEF